jgi:putative nucleotidyltransferase with HDIG domain
MDNSPAGIAIADAPDGKLRYVNDAGLLIRGGDRASLVDGVGIDAYVASWNLLDLDGTPLKPDDVPLARAIMFGETNSREFVIQRAVGDERTVAANAAPIRNDSGQVVSAIAVFTDITELKAAETRIGRLNRVYTVLSNVNQALVHLREPQQIFEKACRVIVEDGGFKMAWVGLVADDGVSVSPVASHGADEAYLDRLGIFVAEKSTGGPVACAIEQRRHIVIGDVEREPEDARWRRNMLSREYLSAAVFPLIVADKAVGAFSIYSEEPGFFDEDQVKLLDELADDISFSLVVAERETQRAHAEERVARSLTSIIEIVSLVSEKRDPYTAGHQRRVSQLATAIAAKIGMPDEDVEEVRIGGLLHDLGKISIPAEILSKPGRLSETEFQLIKGHSEAGYKIITGAHLEGTVAEVVYQHHERCDGSGYPRGLRCEDLLAGAKVIAVADVVEAMMSHRPYRPGLGLDAALEEVEAGAGSLYDAEAVMACVALFRVDGFEFVE